MVQSSCLAGIAGDKVAMFGGVLRKAGQPALATISRLDVTELGRLHPTLVICDVDGLQIDPLEMLRRLRFVLPECLIVVYTGLLERTWCIACHLAGANCVLSKESTAPNSRRVCVERCITVVIRIRASLELKRSAQCRSSR